MKVESRGRYSTDSPNQSERMSNSGFESTTYLNACLERQESVSGIAHLEDSSKSIFCQISYFQYLQLRRNRPQIELIDQDVINDYWRLGDLFKAVVRSSWARV